MTYALTVGYDAAVSSPIEQVSGKLLWVLVLGFVLLGCGVSDLRSQIQIPIPNITPINSLSLSIFRILSEFCIT
ncbi:hypothetical protein [Acaryochloris marina]|uniref:hypothetical protein n=1 Tax=Acaryochloris marina TaxID=155978 RepID=UPI0021C4814D|nr:hypothetical protein [Acaryochloris marina]